MGDTPVRQLRKADAARDVIADALGRETFVEIRHHEIRPSFLPSRQDAAKLRMKRYPELGPGFTLNDPNGGVLEVRARHRRDIGDPLASIKKQREDGALTCPGRPVPLIGGDFIVRPGMEFALGEFLDPQRRIVAAPAIVDGKVNENPDLLENVIRGAPRKDAPRLAPCVWDRSKRRPQEFPTDKRRGKPDARTPFLVVPPFSPRIATVFIDTPSGGRAPKLPT